jgi:hypothetical protein
MFDQTQFYWNLNPNEFNPASIRSTCHPLSLIISPAGDSRKAQYVKVDPIVKTVFRKVKLHFFVSIYVLMPRERRVIHSQVLPTRGPFTEHGGRDLAVGNLNSLCVLALRRMVSVMALRLALMSSPTTIMILPSPRQIYPETQYRVI